MGPRPRKVLVGLVVVALLVVLDQWTKSAVFDWIEGGGAELVLDVHGHRQVPVSGDWLSFMTSCNAGAAFGRFDQFPRILVAGRVLAILFLVYWLVRHEIGQRVVHVAMLLVLAGAIGNVIDNLWTGCGALERPHGVRDFVAVWFEPLLGWDYHFPSFNVADSCISVGAVLWIGSGLFHRRPEDEDPEEARAS